MILSAKSLDRIQLLSLGYISLWTFSPPMAFGNLYRYLLLISMFSWGLAEVVRKDSIITRPSIVVLLVVCYFSYVIFTNSMVDGPEGLIRNIQLFIVMIFILFHEAQRRRGFVSLRPLLYLFLMLQPIWLVSTLFALSIDGHIARALVRSSEVAEEYAARGVGGYALVYTSVLCIPLYLYLLATMPKYSFIKSLLSFRLKSLAQNLLLLANLLLSCLLVMSAGFTIAILILGVIVMIYLLSVLLRSNRPRAVLASALAVTMLAFFVAIPLLNYFAGMSEETRYFRKFADMQVSMEEGEAVGTVGGRYERYSRSIRLALESPVLGQMTVRDVGKHSAILDQFAQYGFIIGSIFVYLFWRVPFRGGVISESPRNTLMAFAVAVVLLSILNSMFATFGFVLFVFLPIVLSYRAVPVADEGGVSLPEHPAGRLA